MKELVRRLTGLNGVSGYEDEVRSFIRKESELYADRIDEDPAGNLIIVKNGTVGRRNVMISAHMDEPGFLVSSITKDGSLRITKTSNIPDAVIPGSRVEIGDERIPGVIGMKPIHLTKRDERLKLSDTDELYIDIGARNREDAAQYITPGDQVCFASEYEQIGKYIKAKALDDRIGCAVLLKLLKETFEDDIVFLFSVQNEISSGAVTAAWKVQPDISITVDCVEADEKNVKTGEGVIIPAVRDGHLMDAAAVKSLRAAADEAEVKMQSVVRAGGRSDARLISEAGAGVPVCEIDVPVRFLKTAAELYVPSDGDAVFKTLRKLLK